MVMLAGTSVPASESAAEALDGVFCDLEGDRAFLGGVPLEGDGRGLRGGRRERRTATARSGGGASDASECEDAGDEPREERPRRRDESCLQGLRASMHRRPRLARRRRDEGLESGAQRERGGEIEAGSRYTDAAMDRRLARLRRA
jgi:hypothetical protein